MIHQMLIVTDHTTHVSTNSLYELAVALQADKRTKHIWVCSRGVEQNKAFFEGNTEAPLFAAPVIPRFAYDPKAIYFLQNSVEIDPAAITSVFIRMPQPLDQRFLLSLGKKWPQAVIINDPAGTILTSSKEFLLTLAHLCPEVQMCYHPDDAVKLSREFEIVLKPLYSYGGRDIARLSTEYFWMGMDMYPVDMIHSIMPPSMFPMLAMRYLPNVMIGDKRTIVVNNQILGSALRVPPPHSWICNIAQGGHASISEADEQELKIEAELTPLLFSHGIVMYGFDTLVDDSGLRVLSEINTLSIGGLEPMEEMSGKPILQKTSSLLWDYVEERLS